jgi:hypothetical protein
MATQFVCLTQKKQGVCHIVALPFTLQKYLKQKEELSKLKYFTLQKYHKKSSK